MNWDLVEQELAAAFQTVAAEADGARVLVPQAPLDLQEVFRDAEEPDDRENEELEAYFYDEFDSVDPRGLLACRWPLSRVLGFEWASMGPMCWFSTLDLFDLGGSRTLVGLNHEEQDYVVLAAVEGGAAGWSLLFPALCEDNGGRYDVYLFGSLPSETENYRRDLVPKAVVREGYRNWLDSEQDGWWMFQESVIKYAAGAAHSSPVERVMARAQVDFGFLDTPPMPNDEFDQNRREFLLDLVLHALHREESG